MKDEKITKEDLKQLRSELLSESRKNSEIITIQSNESSDSSIKNKE